MVQLLWCIYECSPMDSYFKHFSGMGHRETKWKAGLESEVASSDLGEMKHWVSVVSPHLHGLQESHRPHALSI